jgi:hypothetical protein
VEIRDKLALVFWVFMEMLNEALDFIVKGCEFNLRPYLDHRRDRRRDLLRKVEQGLAGEEVDVIRFAPVTVKKLADV